MTDLIRVVVATTDGPSVIRRITAEDPSLRSVVCLAGTPKVLPISPAYDAFVRRPTGIVERDVGHPVFRVDVSGPIDEGDSWQLALYLAHRLKQAGRLAEDDAPATGVIWASGSIDTDLGVGPVARIPDKVRRSADLFAGDLPVLAVVATGTEIAVPADVDLMPIDHVAPVLEALNLGPLVGQTRDRRARPRTSSGRLGLSSALKSLALAGALATIGWVLWPDRPPPIDPGAAALDPAGFDPGAVAFEVIERRPDGDGACEEDGRVVDPGVESPAGVCAVGFRATNRGGQPARFWAYAAVQGTFREYASRKRYTELAEGFLSAGEAGEATVQPPDWVRRPVIVRGILILAPTESAQVDNALLAIDLMPAGQIDMLIDGLRQLGYEVRDLKHRIVPSR